MAQDIFGSTVRLVQHLGRRLQGMCAAPLGNRGNTALVNEHLQPTVHLAAYRLTAPHASGHLQHTDGCSAGERLVHHGHAVLCYPNLLGTGQMLSYPVRPRLLHRHHAHAGTLSLHIRRKILGSAATGSQHNMVARIPDNGVELVDNRLAVPLIFLTRPTDEHEGFALRHRRAGAYAIDSAYRREDTRVVLPTSTQIVPRHDAEIEEAEGQAGLHAHHAKATQMARQTQRGQMGAVTCAENQVRAGQVQIQPLVEQLGEEGFPGNGYLVISVLCIRPQLPPVADEGLRQPLRLRKVSLFSVADDVDNHVRAACVSNRQGYGAAEFLPQEGGIERTAGEGISRYTAAHRRVE